MGSTYQAKAVILTDGNTLPASTILIEQNFVVYVDPITGKYSEIFAWNSIKRIVLV